MYELFPGDVIQFTCGLPADPELSGIIQTMTVGFWKFDVIKKVAHLKSAGWLLFVYH